MQVHLTISRQLTYIHILLKVLSLVGCCISMTSASSSLDKFPLHISVPTVTHVCVTLSTCKPPESCIRIFKGRYCRSTIQENVWFTSTAPSLLVWKSYHKACHSEDYIWQKYDTSLEIQLTISWPGPAGAWMHPATCHERVNNYTKAVDQQQLSLLLQAITPALEG